MPLENSQKIGRFLTTVRVATTSLRHIVERRERFAALYESPICRGT